MRRETWLYAIVAGIGLLANAAYFLGPMAVSGAARIFPDVSPRQRTSHIYNFLGGIDRTMPSTGWIAPSNVVEISGLNGWTGELSAITDNATYARSDVPSGENSAILGFYFDVTLPDGAVPSGVAVRYDAKGESLTSFVANVLRILKAGVLSGTSNPPVGTLPTSDTLYTVGGASDTWGTGISKADVEDPAFGFAVSFTNSGDDGFVYVDFGEINVYYTLPSEGGFGREVIQYAS